MTRDEALQRAREHKQCKGPPACDAICGDEAASLADLLLAVRRETLEQAAKIAEPGPRVDKGRYWSGWFDGRYDAWRTLIDLAAKEGA